MRSSNTGEIYDIAIYLPKRAPPKGGYPVFYVLDGGVLFGSFMEAARNRANSGELDQAVVVGIEGASAKDGSAIQGGGDRFYDFSPSELTPEEKVIIYDADVEARHGGADHFFNFIQRELKPAILSIASINSARSTLFGWSLGGNFALNVMLRNPTSFQGFVALSPSIWWGNRIILDSVPIFFTTIAAQHLHPRLFLGVSSGEGDPAKWFVGDHDDPTKVKREAVYTRMLVNTVNLTADLRSRDTGHLLTINSKIYEGRTHNSVPWEALNGILDFALYKSR